MASRHFLPAVLALILISICLVLQPACALEFIAGPFSEGQLTPEQMQKHFGLQLTKMGSGDCKFSISINNEEAYSLICFSDQMSLKRAWSNLNNLHAQKELSLKQNFHVKIGHDGDLTTGEGYSPRSRKTWLVEVRSPKLSELFALEYALAHSAPSHLVSKSNNCAGVHVCFLKSRRSFVVVAEWGFDRDNQPTIFIEPGYDKTLKGQHPELIIIHELAHNSQVRMGMDCYEPESWKLAEQLGWLPYEDRESRQKGWLICSSESPQHFYRRAAFSSNWIRCNQSGKPLSHEGCTVHSKGEAHCITAQEMSEIALIRPATNYFSNPMEMFAEALMLFRADRNHRKHLLLTSPQLYQIVKEYDDLEISSAAGFGLIRNLDGLLVTDASQVRSEISQFEATAIATSPTSVNSISDTTFSDTF